jgi:hypothetical protein
MTGARDIEVARRCRKRTAWTQRIPYSLSFAVVVVVALAFATPAWAEPPTPTVALQGESGPRVGFGGFGSAGMKGTGPGGGFQLSGGYEFVWGSFGLTLRVGLTFVQSSEQATFSTDGMSYSDNSASVIAVPLFGARFAGRFGWFRIYVQPSVGWSSLRTSYSNKYQYYPRSSPQSGSTSTSGLVVSGVAGVEVQVLKWLAVGPYVEVQVELHSTGGYRLPPLLLDPLFGLGFTFSF